MPSIKGTASVADARARSKALKTTRFPSNFSKKADLGKVNKPVLTQWIEQQVTAILGFEDEIVCSTAINLFLPSDGSSPDPRRAQLDLVGFLGEEESAKFAREVWGLILDAASNSTGIPQKLLEQKKKELAEKKSASKPPANARDDRGPAAQNRNPEMNRFVEEANRRAAAARQMVPAGRDGAEGPVRIPASPPRQSDSSRDYNDGRGGPRNSRDQGEESRRAGSRDYASRPDRSYPPPSHRDGGRRPARGGYDGRDLPDRRPGRQGYGSSPPRDHGGRGVREDDRRRADSWRRDDWRREDDYRRGGGRDRRRYYDEEDEIDDLERRLSVLKKRSTNRGDDFALDEEIEDVKDRLYELERRRRRRRREWEDDYRRRSRRDQEHRRSRSRSMDSKDRRPDPRRSRSPDPARAPKDASSGSDRRERSHSSGRSSMSSSSASGKSVDSYGRRKKRSPQGDGRKERGRKSSRDDRRRRSPSHSSHSSSSYSEDSR